MARTTVAERFWDKVEKSDECWHWTGAMSRNTPHFNKGSRQFTSGRRMAHELAIGPVPDGGVVTNTCGNRRCVRPDHLDLTTRAGMARRNARPSLDVSEADLEEWENLYRSGYSTGEIAERFGCLMGSVWARLRDRGVPMRDASDRRPRMSFHTSGYVRWDGEYVHRIVAEAWYRPIEPGEHVHHIDGDITNNHPSNLRILTAAEHARLHHAERALDLESLAAATERAWQEREVVE